MQQNKLMMIVLGVAILAGLGLIGYFVIADQAAPPPPVDAMGAGIGMPTYLIMFEDGSKAPMNSLLKSDPSDTTGNTYLLQGRKCWKEYKCIKTGKTWAYGRNGQVTSPHIGK